MFDSNRVVQHTGARWPIFQAPMGWIARSRLVSAVSEAGALGILETSSREFGTVRHEMARLSELTGRPWAINLPLAFLRRDDSIVDDVLRTNIRVATTSGGHPGVYARRLREAGIDGVMRAEDAGIDGVIVEGAESAAFRSPAEVHSFTLIQAVRRRVELPIVAAGGIVDGVGMAAAFALGAEGVQMGTRFLASVESPVHRAYKDAITAAEGHATTVTNRGLGPCVRVLRSHLTAALEEGTADFAEALRNTRDMYFTGDLESGLASAGEGVALIDKVETCQQIVDSTIQSFSATIQRLKGHD